MTPAANPRRVRIFVASPGDVAQEREQLAKVVDSLNSTISAVAPEKGISLELVRYETHTYPGFSLDGPQDVIARQLGDIGEFDIFIGIMWHRFGTATQHAQSGTQEEFDSAYQALISGIRRLKYVIFYFCQEKIAIPRTREELQQIGRVIDFRESLSARGLVGQYAERGEFAAVVKAHLDLVLSRIFSSRDAVEEAAKRVGHVAMETSTVREQILGLAREYVAARREPFSDGRTQKLEVIFTKMKGLALLAYPLLTELTRSVPREGGADPGAGERLAAVAMLDALPSLDYVNWLGERVGQERPFVEYHAAVALLNAAREFKDSHAEMLRGVIHEALRNVTPGTDRYRALEGAIAELETR